MDVVAYSNGAVIPGEREVIQILILGIECHSGQCLWIHVSSEMNIPLLTPRFRRLQQGQNSCVSKETYFAQQKPGHAATRRRLKIILAFPRRRNDTIVHVKTMRFSEGSRTEEGYAYR